jgi:DNA (cytosine-5)-methyltransferase 1
MNYVDTIRDSGIDMTDMFCGCGGSTTGAKLAATGVHVRMAINHWDLAIETHNTNHPETDHDCNDISAADPRRYPRTRILWASPECVTHSLAGGGRYDYEYDQQLARAQADLFAEEPPLPNAAAQRSRATMGDVVRFTRHHRYDVVVVENVVDIKRWPLYASWRQEMTALGYQSREVFLNSMFAFPTPQSRDRIYVVFWRAGNRAPNLDFHPPAWCPRCETGVESVQAWRDTPIGRARWGRYQQQYDYVCPRCAGLVEPYYFAAFNCIDWAIPAERIGDRKRPLAAKTLERVAYGLDRFGRQPLIITTRYTSGVDYRVRAAGAGPLPVQPADLSHALLSPFLLQTSRTGAPAFGAAGPADTQTTAQTLGVVGVPFVVDTAFDDPDRSTGSAEVIRAQTTRQTLAVVGSPFLSLQYTPGDARGIHEGAGVITTSDHHALVCPPAWVISMNQYPDKKGVDGAVDPVPTVTTAPARFALAAAPFIADLFGSSKASPVTHQLGAVTAGGVNYGVVSQESVRAFLAHFYSGGGQASGLAEAAPAVTTHDRTAVVEVDPASIRVEDCTFRMLRPHEIGAAMAFPGEYVVLGNQREQVKQLGNAVTPPAARDLIARCIETLL